MKVVENEGVKFFEKHLQDSLMKTIAKELTRFLPQIKVELIICARLQFI
jgi:hypothetical protein